MANAGPQSGSSQFFINTKHNSFLDFFSGGQSKHPVFGKVTSGMEIIKAIEGFGSRSGSTSKPLRVNSITVSR